MVKWIPSTLAILFTVGLFLLGYTACENDARRSRECEKAGGAEIASVNGNVCVKSENIIPTY